MEALQLEEEQRSSTRGKAKAKAKQQSKAKRGVDEGVDDGDGKARAGCCFICPQKKQSNSRYCKEHHRPFENMKYQAEQSGRKKEFLVTMSDPGKARVEVTRFMQENPTGAQREDGKTKPH